MVTRRPCPHCKGDRVLKVRLSDGRDEYRKCPVCNGTGYTVRLLHTGELQHHR